MREDERELLGGLSTPAIASDASGHIIHFNEAATALLGWTPVQVVGKPLTVIMPERMREKHRAGIARYLATHRSSLLGKPVRVPALKSDGTERDIDLTLRLFRRPDGSDLIVATLREADASGTAPAGLVELESKLQRRMYQLI